ncbi:FHA domain-containing protein [Planctomicrobium sp. SH527]|uniref:FHA domain-containing protein n=1 Tax=Planctomicrobium sp. SH527 TaxID=3448123 RepID=UPI003F5CBA7C
MERPETSNPRPVLEIQTGKHKGQRITLSADEVIIGRGETARIRLPSPDVSREHCRLAYSNRRLIVEDLKSRNGTFINGRPITGKRYIAPGHTLTIGPMTFLLLGAAIDEAPAVGLAVSGKRGIRPDLSDDDVMELISDRLTTEANLKAMETSDHIPIIPREHPLSES